MQGTLVAKHELINEPSHTFNIGNFSSGLYIIRVSDGTKERTSWILKQ